MSHIQPNKSQPALVLRMLLSLTLSKNIFSSFNFTYNSRQDATPADMELFQIKPSTVNITCFKEKPVLLSHPHLVPPGSHPPLFSPQPATLPQYFPLSASHFIWAWGEVCLWLRRCSLVIHSLTHSATSFRFPGQGTTLGERVRMSHCICLNYLRPWCMCMHWSGTALWPPV